MSERESKDKNADLDINVSSSLWCAFPTICARERFSRHPSLYVIKIWFSALKFMTSYVQFHNFFSTVRPGIYIFQTSLCCFFFFFISWNLIRFCVRACWTLRQNKNSNIKIWSKLKRERIIEKRNKPFLSL